MLTEDYPLEQPTPHPAVGGPSPASASEIVAARLVIALHIQIEGGRRFTMRLEADGRIQRPLQTLDHQHGAKKQQHRQAHLPGNHVIAQMPVAKSPRYGSFFNAGIRSGFVDWRAGSRPKINAVADEITNANRNTRNPPER